MMTPWLSRADKNQKGTEQIERMTSPVGLVRSSAPAAIPIAEKVATRLTRTDADRRAERDATQNTALDAAVKEEADNIVANDRAKTLRGATVPSAPAQPSDGIQTETATYDENGNLKVTPGGERGAPGVLAYYNASKPSYSQNGNTARVDFGQGKNYAEFDVTQAPAGAAERIQHTIANNPEFYGQSKKYIGEDNRGLPEQNDLNLRTRAAQGGGMSYGQDPEAVKQARLASYANASNLINQTRAIARGLDPRLAGQLDKQNDGTLRAASKAMRQQESGGQTLAEQIALERAGLRQAQGKEKTLDPGKATFDWISRYEQDPKTAGRYAGWLHEYGVYPRNEMEAKQATTKIRQMEAMLPPEAVAAGINPLSLSVMNSRRRGITNLWGTFGNDVNLVDRESGLTFGTDVENPILRERIYEQNK
jgi:hypothetical protein